MFVASGMIKLSKHVMLLVAGYLYDDCLPCEFLSELLSHFDVNLDRF